MTMHYPLPFHKFHGTGNDFILIDNRVKQDFTVEQISLWCNRHLGVGADGFILLENGNPDGDFFMRYFNADGKEASLCGNGSRCAVAFAHYLAMIEKQCTFMAFDGIHHAEILSHEAHQWQIALQMKDIAEIKSYEDGFFTDTGSPHFVQYKENIDEMDVYQEGKTLRHDPRFANGCNVNFITPKDNGIYVRTYERGVEDETLSCGTGVTASALVWALIQQLHDGAHTIPVHTLGGNLTVKFHKQGESFHNIHLEGPVVHAFSGVR